MMEKKKPTVAQMMAYLKIKGGKPKNELPTANQVKQHRLMEELLDKAQAWNDKQVKKEKAKMLIQKWMERKLKNDSNAKKESHQKEREASKGQRQP